MRAGDLEHRTLVATRVYRGLLRLWGLAWGFRHPHGPPQALRACVHSHCSLAMRKQANFASAGAALLVSYSQPGSNVAPPAGAGQGRVSGMRSR